MTARLHPTLALVGLLATATPASSAPAADTPRILSIEGEASWRDAVSNWRPLKVDKPVVDEMAFRSSTGGKIRLCLGPGMFVTLEGDSELALQGLERVGGVPMVWLELWRGRMEARIEPHDGRERNLAVKTDSAFVRFENSSFKPGAPEKVTFSMEYAPKPKFTTVAVMDGEIEVTGKADHHEFKLPARQQVSMIATKTGPRVRAGATPTLEKPHWKEAVLNFGQWEITEVANDIESYSGWLWNRQAQRFDAKWRDGTEAEITVEEIGGGELVLVRRDTKGPKTGLTARYVGRNGRTIFRGDLAHSTLDGTVEWTWQGVTTTGTWHAVSPYLINLQPEL